MKNFLIFLVCITIFCSFSCNKNNSHADNDVYDDSLNEAEADDDLFNENNEEADNQTDFSDSDNDVDDYEISDFSDTDSELSDEDFVEIPYRFYVKSDANGKNDGSSWKNAFTDLQDAIDNATQDYEIWVAKGVYKPSRPGNTFFPKPDPEDEEYQRYYSFLLKSKVVILGGFNGTETDSSERDWIANETILSGDIDDSGDLSDRDAYNVFLNYKVDDKAILDGFIIKGGNANGKDSSGMEHSSKQGGGMYNTNTANPTINNCVFRGNYASLSGGAIANIKSNPGIRNSVFENNSSLKGGAVSNDSSSPNIQNTVFKNNSALNGYGGAVFNSGKSRGFFINCSFNKNKSRDGGAIVNTLDSEINVYESVFKENEAENSGGAMSNSQSNPVILSSTFENNISGIGGGAIENYIDSNPKIIYSIFKNNHVSGMGDGGAILNSSGIPIVVSSLFYNNSAENGGAIANSGSSGYFIGNTFYNNSACGDFGTGGAMYNILNSNPVITNSIFYENSTNSKTNQIFNKSSVPEISYSNIQNCFSDGIWDGLLGLDLGGNTWVYPGFVNPSENDFSLKKGSECIDAGTNDPYLESGIASSFQNDIAGNSRIINITADIGAYEYKE